MTAIEQLKRNREALTLQLCEAMGSAWEYSNEREQRIKGLLEHLLAIGDEISKLANAIPHEQGMWFGNSAMSVYAAREFKEEFHYQIKSYDYHLFPIQGDPDHQPINLISK
jgi:hypothetical protein